MSEEPSRQDVMTQMALVRQDVRHMKEAVDTLSDGLGNYVTKEKFESEIKSIRQELSPLQKIVYGAAGLILVGVFTALIALVVAP